MGKGEPLWLALKTTTENTSPSRRKIFRDLKSKVVNSADVGAIDEFAKVLDPKIVEFGAPEVAPLICRVMSPKVKPSNFLIAKSTEWRIPFLPAVITCAANSELLIAVPAVTTPTLDWSKNGAAQGVVGGNTVGSKTIVCAPAVAVAVVIASLRLPGPESLVFVTTIVWAQDDAAPKSKKLKATQVEKFCAECDRLRNFFMARFSVVVLMRLSAYCNWQGWRYK
jgi:hypothetical protein